MSEAPRPEATRDRRWSRVVALSGGVGGARLVHGLAAALPTNALSVVVNTGDDFEHWGLWVSPDLDTLMYTLAGLAPVERGWGLAEESFAALDAVRRLGGADWFALGDRDLATHLVRTEALRSGETLTAVSARLARALGVATPLLPMCDAPAPTTLDTREHGTLPFQRWLVEHRAPPVRAVHTPPGPASPAALTALRDAELIVLGPSNPYVSVDPILARQGLRELFANKLVVAVSPLVGGAAVKGPLAEMVPALAGVPASNDALVAHYGALVDAWIIHRDDPCTATRSVLRTDTLMPTRADSLRLARELLDFAAHLRERSA